MQHERRLHPRLDIRLEAVFRLEGSDVELRGTIRDLSAGGAALFTHDPIASGALIRPVRFHLPGPDGEVAIEVHAVVVHSRPDRSFGGEAGTTSGLQFLDLHGAPFERVRRFVYERLNPTDG